MKLRKRILSLACAFALMMGMVVTAPGAFAAEAEWVEKAPMTTARASLGMEAVNGKIYTFGGLYHSSTEIYNPDTNTWSLGTPMPSSLHSFGSAVLGDKIYVVGGRASNGSNSVKSIYIYDTVKDTWATGPNLRKGLEACSVEIIGNKLYVIGGVSYTGTSSSQVYLTDTDILDLSTETWSYGTSIRPAFTQQFGSCVIDNQIYLLAYNRNASPNGIIIDRYDPILDKWYAGERLTYADASNAAIVLAEKAIYVIGGTSNRSGVNIYDTQTATWKVGPPLLNNRFMHAGTYLNGTIYISGGNIEGTTSLNSMQALRILAPQSSSKLSVLLNPTETVQLSVSNTLSDNASYTWTSTDAAVATVDANGKVTAVSPGTCDIFAENADGSFKESIPIRVVASGADLFRLAVHLTPGQSKKLYMTEDPTATTWTSLDPSVATVDTSGKITAVAPGLVLMQATIGTETQQVYVRVK